MLTFDIIFATTLPQSPPLLNSRLAAIVSSSLVGVDVSLLMIMLGRQFRYRNGAHIQDIGRGRRSTYLLAGIAGAFGVLAAVSSSILLGMTTNQFPNIPQESLIVSARLVTGGFIVWAVYLLSQALFLICMLVNQKKKNFREESHPYSPEPEREMFPQMEESNKMPAQDADRNIDHREKSSLDSRTPPSSSGRSRAGSDAMYSIRSSLSQVVRPITSKTRLIQGGHKSPHRPTSINSSHSNMDDGFDSWDTSAVDAHSRHAVESVSPTPQRFLETIPASPTTSRSPSPGFPLDLEPPKTRTRSRSYSPAQSPSDRERFRGSRTTSPTESTNEAHIHPLFRTDSPTPAPEATPGTIVTAAPNAGQLISDRQSIRSIHRMRSGSLPSSPIGSTHSESLDSIRKKMEKEEIERLQAGGERTITPPVPDFILNAAPRNSLSGYNFRKKSLQKVGE